MATEFVQTKAEQKFYTWDFSDIIGNNNISSYQLNVDGLVSTNTSSTNKTVTTKITTSNAEVSRIYRLACSVNTSNLEVFQMIISVLIVEV